jgi:ABC-type nitrate/sulfonate/bicarbonate transport system permease component
MIAGVQAVSEIRLRAAASLGAGPVRTLLTVIVPSTVPFMLTGARLSMGNSFLTIVSAEIVAAQEGLGALIWMSRNYARTEWVFVGIIVLGLLGYACDRVLRFHVSLSTGFGLQFNVILLADMYRLEIPLGVAKRSVPMRRFV